MKLSTKATYAVRALFHMAYHSPYDTCSLSHIAEQEGIDSQGFLDQIFQSLRKAGIVGSKRGPHGGYFLARPPHEISLRDIIHAVDGETTESFCRERHDIEMGARPSGRCVTSAIWRALGDEIDDILQGVTLRDMVVRGESIGLTRDQLQGFVYVI